MRKYHELAGKKCVNKKPRLAYGGLVVHAHDLGVVNLRLEFNMICCVEGESCVILDCDFVYY